MFLTLVHLCLKELGVIPSLLVSLEYTNYVRSMQSPFVIHQHGKSLPIQERQMAIDFNKSGNGYKTIHKGLNVPRSTVRAIIKQ